MALPLEQIGERTADPRFIIHHENRPPFHEGSAGLLEGARPFLLPFLYRELDAEDGSMPRLASHTNGASMPFDDPPAQRQPQAGADARGLGGEERLEDPLLELGSKPWSGIGHFQVSPHLLEIHASRERQTAGRWGFAQ